MVTDPLNLVGGFIGKAGLRGLSQVGALAGKTRLGKAAGRAVVPDFELRGLARRGDAFNRDVGEGAFNTEALDKFIAERTGIRNLADAETREYWTDTGFAGLSVAGSRIFWCNLTPTMFGEYFH